MIRRDVLDLLGDPDDFLPGLSTKPDDFFYAYAWIYGGVELHFEEPNSIELSRISAITFKPGYLFPPDDLSGDEPKLGKEWKTQIDRWIFVDEDGPTKQQLCDALDEKNILYVDTGLEMLVWDETLRNFKMIEFQESLLHSPGWNERVNECVGTLVLKSGIQVRYDEKGKLLNIMQGGDWWYKGKEQEIDLSWFG